MIDPRSLAVLERSEDVAGVYPVRAAFPAAVSSEELGGDGRPRRPSSGFDGRGVTVALLDTGVDRSEPALARRVLNGVDIVGGSPRADAAAKPGSTEGSSSGTGPSRPGSSSASRTTAAFAASRPARRLPIRVAGWQPAADGHEVYARTDQVLAGLDRAVDPNGDGDAHDAARVALIGVAARFAAFEDDPLARRGRCAGLDTLVVAPAGNDGPKAALRSISAPAAPPALTVGAADVRPGQQQMRVVVRAGLDLLVDRVAPLAAITTPVEPMTLPIARPRMFVQQGRSRRRPPASSWPTSSTPAASAASLGRLRSSRGREPGRVVEAAVQAGAAAVLVYGSAVPPGGLGLDDGPDVPVAQSRTRRRAHARGPRRGRERRRLVRRRRHAGQPRDPCGRKLLLLAGSRSTGA